MHFASPRGSLAQANYNVKYFAQSAKCFTEVPAATATETVIAQLVGWLREKTFCSDIARESKTE